MTFGARARVVNPRLGTYFSIFAALFTALFLLVLIFEQLKLNESLLRLAFFAGPILIYAGIGLSVGSNDTLNYFAAGRRVPAAYTGLLLAASAMGAISGRTIWAWPPSEVRPSAAVSCRTTK